MLFDTINSIGVAELVVLTATVPVHPLQPAGIGTFTMADPPAANGGMFVCTTTGPLRVSNLVLATVPWASVSDEPSLYAVHSRLPPGLAGQVMFSGTKSTEVQMLGSPCELTSASTLTVSCCKSLAVGCVLWGMAPWVTSTSSGLPPPLIASPSC